MGLCPPVFPSFWEPVRTLKWFFEWDFPHPLSSTLVAVQRWVGGIHFCFYQPQKPLCALLEKEAFLNNFHLLSIYYMPLQTSHSLSFIQSWQQHLLGRYYNDRCFTDEKTEFYMLWTWPVSGLWPLRQAVWSDMLFLTELSKMLKGDVGAEFPRKRSGGKWWRTDCMYADLKRGLKMHTSIPPCWAFNDLRGRKPQLCTHQYQLPVIGTTRG